MGRLLLVLALAAPALGQGGQRLRAEHRTAVIGLQPQIDQAIDKGVEYLLGTQLRDGSWSYEQRYFATGQTALGAYTLMKAGLPPTHSAVQRALTFVRHSEPTMVYAIGAQLLALCEAGDPADLELIEERAKHLLRLQEGSWTYPNDRGVLTHLHTDRDLSITQFALLGLWAASRAGVDIPRGAWRAALKDVLDYQEKPNTVDAPRVAGRTGSPVREIAGFRYRWSARTASSGSMTTAGVACLGILRDRLGPRSRQPELEVGIQRGLAWLDHHYTVTTNPGGGNEWHYYYLYGVERVAALCDVAYLGEHPWYLDGARELLRLQKPEGHWERRRNLEPDTCFAILFLKRATATAMTGVSRKDPALTIAEDPEHAVGMRARGGVDGSPLDLWLTRIGLPGDAEDPASPPHVERVDYLVDDVVVATVAADPSQPWRGERHAAKHAFQRSGKVHVSARVHVVAAAAGEGREPTREVLLAPGFDLDVQHVLEDWMLEAARMPSANLLRSMNVQVSANASSTWSDGHRAQYAADGLEATGWCCAPGDATPTLRLQLNRTVPARILVLNQAGGTARTAGQFDAIRRLEVRVKKGQTPILVEVPTDSRVPIRVPLPNSVRDLELTITERQAGGQHQGIAGFQEVLLVR